MTCSVSIYASERIGNESMRFSIYKDGAKLTDARTYNTTAEPPTNGNYTCRAEATSLSYTDVAKESQALVVKAKGESCARAFSPQCTDSCLSPSLCPLQMTKRLII